MKSIIGLSLFCLILSSCTSDQKQAKVQLDAYCDQLKTLATSIPDPAARSAQLSEWISQNIKHKKLVEGFSALAMVEASQRTRLLVSLASDAGVKDWSCPAVELWNEQPKSE